jgi:hypothetical protein
VSSPKLPVDAIVGTSARGHWSGAASAYPIGQDTLE